MKPLDSRTLDLLWFDPAAREERIREIVTGVLAETPAPGLEDSITATYFVAGRTLRLEAAADSYTYHATSGVKNPPAGSLLAACTSKTVGVVPFDGTGRIGIIHLAFPLKMMLHPDGTLTALDILHTVAGPIMFDVYESRDVRLVGLRIPDRILHTFPGPAHGPAGLRRMTGFAPDQPAFGTILKPTAGITPDLVGRLVEEAARCPLFMFVKEDENLYPDLDYSPAAERAARAAAGIERAKAERGGLGLIFAPHVSGSPHQILDTVDAVLAAGARGVMFSETFAGGVVRMVREHTRNLPAPPAIYGHNAGIGTRTPRIWREIIDLLARLEGIDFRQTAPVKPGPPFLLPYGQEWTASEEVLARPLPGIAPTMIVRAGGLDQGNIILNLMDVEHRGLTEGVLFLAGSAINSIRNAAGQPDPRLGAEAMMQAIDVYRSGELAGVAMDEHLRALIAVAERRSLKALRESLRQRYPQA
jgi:ribulose 1,5-bisphosphate carboxylase large subunit-like protein